MLRDDVTRREAQVHFLPCAPRSRTKKISVISLRHLGLWCIFYFAHCLQTKLTLFVDGCLIKSEFRLEASSAHLPIGHSDHRPRSGADVISEQLHLYVAKIEGICSTNTCFSLCRYMNNAVFDAANGSKEDTLTNKHASTQQSETAFVSLTTTDAPGTLAASKGYRQTRENACKGVCTTLLHKIAMWPILCARLTFMHREQLMSALPQGPKEIWRNGLGDVSTSRGTARTRAHDALASWHEMQSVST